MAYQDLLSIDLRRIVKSIINYVSREMPNLTICERVLEVSLEPDLDLLYVRFNEERGSAYGEYIGNYIHVFIRDNKVVAIEIIPFSKFIKEFKI